MNGAQAANVAAVVLLAAAIGWAAWRTARRLRRGGGCCGEHEGTVRRTGGRRGGRYVHTAELKIGGMTCANCARRVENALNGLKDVRAAVRIDTRSARVRCAHEPDEAALREAVRQAGYVVTEYRVE